MFGVHVGCDLPTTKQGTSSGDPSIKEASTSSSDSTTAAAADEKKTKETTSNQDGDRRVLRVGDDVKVLTVRTKDGRIAKVLDKKTESSGGGALGPALGLVLIVLFNLLAVVLIAAKAPGLLEKLQNDSKETRAQNAFARLQRKGKELDSKQRWGQELPKN
jgi:hypothetical protein